jgi:hypothetical protein
MPKLWLANIDEAFSPRCPDEDELVFGKSACVTPRFLYCLQKGDALVLPAPVPVDFLSYVCRLLGFSRQDISVFYPQTSSSPYYLVDSTLADKSLVAQLSVLVSRGDWLIEPYIETRRVLTLADALGLSAGRMPRQRIKEGLGEFLNNKYHFKHMARQLQIPVVEGIEAGSRQEIEEAIARLAARGFPRLMLRKAMGGGGMGNLAGSPPELTARLDSYYQGGMVLVEPYLDLHATLGSLVEITEKELVFRGIDCQLIEEGRWVGFSYPLPAGVLAGLVKNKSMKMAAYLQQLGARGYMNLDWGVLEGQADSSSLVALECNFRHNGFSHILDLVGRCTGQSGGDFHILIKDNLVVFPAQLELNGLLSRLRNPGISASGSLIESPGQTCGFLPLLPPHCGLCAMVFFSSDSQQPEEMRRSVEKILTGTISCAPDELAAATMSFAPGQQSTGTVSFAPQAVPDTQKLTASQRFQS